jgi:hypothetical protein
VHRSLGCLVDCGTERDLRDVVIVIKGDLARSPLGATYTYQLLRNTRWNLCMADPARRAAQLDDVCWYQQDEPVSALPKVRSGLGLRLYGLRFAGTAGVGASALCMDFLAWGIDVSFFVAPFAPRSDTRGLRRLGSHSLCARPQSPVQL